MKKAFCRVITIFILVVMVFSLSGCSEEKTAGSNLTKCLDLLKSGKYYEAVSEYIYNKENANDFLGCSNEFNEEAFPCYKMHKAIFDSLEYKIKDTKTISETEIHFTVEISYLDCEEIGNELAEMTAGYNITANNAEDDEKLSDSELNDMMTKQLQNISNKYLDGNKLKTSVQTVDISMGYTSEGKWVIVMSEDLYNVLTGNVYKAYYETIQNAGLVSK